MPVHPIKFLGIVDGLLIPVQKVIAIVLPDFLQQDLKDPAIRDHIVVVADEVLIRQHPEAKLVPQATRRRIIRKLLDVTLDEVLLPDQL